MIVKNDGGEQVSEVHPTWECLGGDGHRTAGSGGRARVRWSDHLMLVCIFPDVCLVRVKGIDMASILVGFAFVVTMLLFVALISYANSE